MTLSSKEKRRSYYWLWWVWLLWLTGIAFTVVSEYVRQVAVMIACFVVAAFVLNVSIVNVKRQSDFMNIFRRKNGHDESDRENTEVLPKHLMEGTKDAVPVISEQVQEKPLTEINCGVKLISVRKDTFISPGTRFTGGLESEGNIIIEGYVEGNVTSEHQVRIEPGGGVMGDIQAKHITVNGRAEGRCIADAISLMQEGYIEGDIVTDELSIEKGGVFIGQSILKREDIRPERKDNESIRKPPRKTSSDV